MFRKFKNLIMIMGRVIKIFIKCHHVMVNRNTCKIFNFFKEYYFKTQVTTLQFCNIFVLVPTALLFPGAITSSTVLVVFQICVKLAGKLRS